MSEIQFDRYYKYAEMTSLLQAWAEQYPKLCQLESIGQSYEERDILCLTITNLDTGPAADKPAYWVDGNIHATELSASTAALYLINKLLTEFGQNDKISYLLDSRAFYIVPRLNPDGAEWALADSPKFIRSSTKPYPRQDQLDGFIEQDVDGDGRILQMRVPDPDGSWKKHPKKPHLMIQREPDDLPSGDYYRLLPEGTIQNYDGVMIKQAPALQGLDLNRQFPVYWTPEQRGAGDFAGSEPEPRAAIEFVVAHPNITGAVTLHTFSGVHLRPPTKGPDSELPTADLTTYKKIGAKGEALTGYPAISVYHDFAYDSKTAIKGTFDDWMYEFRGAYAWTTEIWSPQRMAGITDYKYIDWFHDHPVEHDEQILAWFEKNVKAESYFKWKKFDHPQLGTVELGGWNNLHTFRNPPLEMLEKEIAPLADFCIHNCLISPKLELFSADVTSGKDDMYHIELVVQNTGWLPTQVSEQALKMKAVEPIEVDIDLPDEAKLVTGKAKQFAGQLPGRNHKNAFQAWSFDGTENRAKFEWMVQAPAGTKLYISAKHDRAGKVVVEIDL